TSSGLKLLEQLSNKQLKQDRVFQQVLETIRPTLDYDQVFADSFLNRKVVLSFFSHQQSGSLNLAAGLPKPISKQPDNGSGDFIYQAKGYGGSLELLQDAAIYGGFFNNPLVDQDGVYRRLPLLMSYQNKLYPSFSLAIIQSLLEGAAIELISNEQYHSTPDQARLEKIQLESFTIPVDEQAAIYVPYRGKQGSFQYVSVTDILSAQSAVDLLQDKIVIVGTTAAGLLDLRSTPVQNVYPGVEVHANVVAGILDQTIKSRPAYIIGFEVAEFFLLGLLAIFIMPRLSLLNSLLLLVVVSVVIIGINGYLWQELKINSLLVSPLILFVLLFSIQILFAFFFETRKKNWLSKIFGQYVPPELVEQMSQSETEFSLSGESREMTVLFSDVRGFTAISEKLAPEQLCQVINEILTPVTRQIHQYQGTIDKYMGDAVMAFWGAPVVDSQHAHNAVASALSIVPALQEQNEQFQAKGLPPLEMGIGLNTGVMSVGNMGSQFRVAYTVMGDAVNLGSRLEGLTKMYGVHIIVSEFTQSAAPAFFYRELDKVQVKGKQEAVSIYEPLCQLESLTVKQQQCVDIWHKALNQYRNKNWEEANSLLRELLTEHPEDKLYTIYLQRIEQFQATPPAVDWDGVFVSESK
ncbi:MAG: CHASE2 domain-containing protein, partial [Methylococcaceae bacterium]|nr:CHASE2 domain-containing protein [Methylococcaceae bacterium]